MKRLFKGVAWAGVVMLLAFTALADVGTSDFGGTNAVPAETTQSTAAALGSAVDVSNYHDVGVVVSFKGLDADTGDVVVKIIRSGDNTTFESAAAAGLTITNAANGTNTVVSYTPVPVTTLGSAGYLKLLSVQNAATNGITNLTVKVIKKRPLF